MNRIADAARRFHTLLAPIAEESVQRSGVVQRASKLGGAVLLQTLILGWLEDPEASLARLTILAAARQVAVSPQALDQRFTPALVTALERLLGATVALLADQLAGEPVAIPLLQRFTGVWILDSTTVRLPDDCADRWPGCGGHPGTGASALKIQTRWDLRSGGLDRLELMAGRAQDRSAAAQHAPLPVGSLRLSDQGYFCLGVFQAIADAGSFWLSRLPSNIAILTEDDRRIPPDTVPAWLARQARADGTVEVDVQLGLRDRLPARLLAVRVPDAVAAERRQRLQEQAQKKGQPASQRSLDRAGWTLLVTNVPADQLSLNEARALYRARWQIECLFKRWKHDARLATSRSQKSVRIQAELLAKLIGQVLQHWLSLLGDWADPDKSLAQMGWVIRTNIPLLAVALDSPRALRQAFAHLQRALRAATRVTHRKKHPSTAQYLLNPDLEP